MRRGTHRASPGLVAATCGVVGAVAAALYAWSLAPVYSADAVVRPAASDTRALMGNLTGRDTGAEPIDTGILTSRTVLGRVVRDNGLDIEAAPRQVPVLGALWALWALSAPAPQGVAAPPPLVGAVAGLDRFGWGGEAIAIGRFEVGRADGVDGGEERGDNRVLTLVAGGSGRYRVESADGRLLLTGTVGETARGAGMVLRVDRLVARPGTVFSLRHRDEASAVEQLARTLSVVPRGAAGDGWQIAWRDTDRHRVAAVVNDIARTYVERQAAYRQQEAERALAFVQGELPRVRAELEQAEGALARYRARSGSLQPTQEAQSYLSGSIEYQRQISALRVERARLLRYFTGESQEVRAVDAQIAQLDGDRRRLDSRLHGLSEAERESVALTRDVRVAEDTYMRLRNREQALMLARADRGGEVRLLDPAVVPVLAAGPPRARIAAAGGASGLLVGAALAMLLRRRRGRMADAATLEGRFHLPVLGEIVYSPEQLRLEREAPATVALTHERTPVLLAHALPRAGMDPVMGRVDADVVHAATGHGAHLRGSDPTRQGNDEAANGVDGANGANGAEAADAQAGSTADGATDEWCGLSLAGPEPEPPRHAGVPGTWMRHDAFRRPPLPVAMPGPPPAMTAMTVMTAMPSSTAVSPMAALAPVGAPRTTVLHDRYLLARRAPDALAVETLRSLRAALHFILASAPNGVLAMTSATAAAGKTFGAINLAVLAAEAGRRVLLVDADLRQGDVATRLGQPAAPGLAELLGGMTTLAHVMQPTAVAGLALLPAGAPPRNPAELLMLPALRDTLQSCDASFDLVIVDTPPVLAVADATFVSHLAGATLLCVRADDTPADKVAEAVRRLHLAGARLVGSVLNAVDADHAGRHAETRDFLRRGASSQAAPLHPEILS